MIRVTREAGDVVFDLTVRVSQLCETCGKIIPGGTVAYRLPRRYGASRFKLRYCYRCVKPEERWHSSLPLTSPPSPKP
jgi:hypothetical protein